MYPFYPHYQLQQHQQQQQQFSPWFNGTYMPQVSDGFHRLSNPQYSLPSFNLVNHYPTIINKDPKTLSDTELLNLLDQQTNRLKQLHTKDQQEQLPILTNLLTILIRVPKSIFVSTLQNEFFSLLRTPLTDILKQWSHQPTSLSTDESFIFRAIIKLIRKLIKATDDIKQIPAWLSDSTLLEAISTSLTEIANSSKFFDQNNKSQFKSFTYLIDAYIRYQVQLNQQHQFQKDKLIQLLDPILQCLLSSQYIHTFTNLSTNSKSMTTIEKFFLIKVPSFLTSYYGSRLEQTMDRLLSSMLSRYVELFSRFVPSSSTWKRSMIRSFDHLLDIINHGSDQFQVNAKHVSNHLSLIDNVLKLLNEPILYDNIDETLSNVETIIVNRAISFLVNMINEPTILSYIKQSRSVGTFLRLTSCKYEPMVYNVYTLLAYTTREEDIKAMQKPGRLLTIILKALRTTLNRTPDDKNHIEQLLETLKGLVQHDQIKDEIVKQNALPFLVDCTNKVADKAQVLNLEILWSLTFREESALALRSNENFLKKIQTITNDNKNEALKKASDGLVWKLIREPSSLMKVAKQEEEDRNAVEGVMETIVEEIVNEDGQKQLVTKVKPVVNTSGERTFEYDIMISYCHADKELTYKIHKFLLDQGFKVWIDLDNMYGPAMSAMADAVENSEFVIMCMSDSYKQSTYCQAEAEYAFNCKRRLIPLIMRPGYRPDGWLGFMIGSRIYIDYGRFDFETACEKLMIEINHQRNRPPPPKPTEVTQHEIPTKTISTTHQIPPPRNRKSSVIYNNNAFSVYTRRKPLSNFTRKPILQWTDSDVLDFLFTQRLIQMMPLCESMDGRALIQLYKMAVKRSSKIYTLLDDELKSLYKMKLPLKVFTQFLSAIEQRLSEKPLRSSQNISQVPRTIVTTYSQEYISNPVKPSVNNRIPVEYPSYSDKPYDLVITSNASASEVLRAVHLYAPNVEKISSVLKRSSTRY